MRVAKSPEGAAALNSAPHDHQSLLQSFARTSGQSLESRDRLGLEIMRMYRYGRIYLLTLIASFGGMLWGWDNGIIGGILVMPSFQRSFKVDSSADSFKDFQGNIVSIFQAGSFFGAGSSYYISDRFGRKPAIVASTLIILIGIVLQTFPGTETTSLDYLYAGRVITGYGTGIIASVIPAYIGEHAPKDIRDRCIATMQLFSVTGIMLSYFIDYGANRHLQGSRQWRIPFALQSTPAVILFCGIMTQPESPRWLIKKRRREEALHVLAYMQMKPLDDLQLTREFDDLVQDALARDAVTVRQQLRAIMSDRTTLYQCSVGVIIQCLQQWTGTNALNYYSPQIFASIGLSTTSSTLFATGIYGVVKVVSTALAVLFTAEQLGRKRSLLAGAVGQAFAMYYIGVHTAISPPITGERLTSSAVFAIVCVYLFVFFYSFGWGPLPIV